MGILNTTLGESCNFFNGKAHEKNIVDNGKYVVVNSKFISSDGLIRKYSSEQMFPLYEGDIVMVMSDVPNGKALAKCYKIEENNRYSLNQRICAIRTDKFDIDFLLYQLNRNPHFLAFNNGENQTNLRKGDILDCPLWKPSLIIQKQIVQILDQAFEKIDFAIETVQKNIKNAEELFHSELIQIFTRNSGDWEKKRVKEIFKTGAGGTPLKSKRAYYENGNIPWLLSGEVKQGEIHQATSFITKEGLENSSAKIFPENSILIAMYGATAGDVGILKFEASTNQAVCAILPNEKFLPEFIYYNFLFKRKELVSKATGNAQPNISQIKIKETTIPIIPLAQQKILVEKLRLLGERKATIIKTYQRKLDILMELKGAILENAFKGELTKEEVTV